MSHFDVPQVPCEADTIADRLIVRINEASAPYQMFGVVGDIVLLQDRYADHEPSSCEYLEDVLVMANATILPPQRPYISFTFEYGANFSYPGADTFRDGRVVHQVRCVVCNMLERS